MQLNSADLETNSVKMKTGSSILMPKLITNNSPLTTPYQPPSQHAVTDLVMDAGARKRRVWLLMILASAAGLIASPVLWVLGLIIAANCALEGLGSTPESINMEIISRGSSIAATSTNLAVLIGLISLVTLIVAILRFRRLPKPSVSDLELRA